MFFETPTVAVLGSGVNVPYPSSNAPMLDWIAEHGMVVSEYPPNTPPNGRNFPVRNRIISGLCDALIVVEAGEKSGALITARYAADQHRRVYAVPGNVGSPGSAGTNNLIRDGAKLVARSEDVLEDFIEQFNLKQVEKIVSSDKYLRYEYNTRIPVSPENLPIHPTAQKKPVPPPARENAVPQPKPKPPAAGSAQPRQESRRPDAWESLADSDGVKIVHTVKPLRRQPVEAEEAREIAPEPPRRRIADEAPAKAPEIPAKEQAEKRSHVLSRLEPICTQVFDAIPEGRAATTDQIVKTGIPAEDVMAALTMLELYSAVELMPGGMYRKLI
jgi:predicted Rossmann fold nucleotide-binding protein DprA/Smf involved in DNA uptake